MGANAIIEAEYENGITWTSWRAMKGRGLAVRRLSDEISCAVCAEKIKRAATKCRFCGSAVEASPNEMAASLAPTRPGPVSSESYHEPLRSSDSIPAWVWVLVSVVAFIFMLMALGSV